jgi:membrane protease YdiL (CAAX protease family)
MVASLWIIAVVSVLVAAGVTLRGWWHDVGYTSPSAWRETWWLAVPFVLTLLPLVAGLKPMDASAFWFLVLGYALTGFAEETMFRGVLVKVLAGRSPLQVASITAILFGLVHLSNILIRGNPAVIASQAVGAAAFGFGYAALRMRTNALLPLVAAHLLTDLFLQMGNLPLIPVAVGQDVVLFLFGLWLLRGLRAPA